MAEQLQFPLLVFCNLHLFRWQYYLSFCLAQPTLLSTYLGKLTRHDCLMPADNKRYLISIDRSDPTY